jgi:hypothetical protein
MRKLMASIVMLLGMFLVPAGLFAQCQPRYNGKLQTADSTPKGSRSIHAFYARATDSVERNLDTNCVITTELFAMQAFGQRKYSGMNLRIRTDHYMPG